MGTWRCSLLCSQHFILVVVGSCPGAAPPPPPPPRYLQVTDEFSKFKRLILGQLHELPDCYAKFRFHVNDDVTSQVTHTHTHIGLCAVTCISLSQINNTNYKHSVSRAFPGR